MRRKLSVTGVTDLGMPAQHTASNAANPPRLSQETFS